MSRSGCRAQGGYTLVRPGEAPAFRIAGDHIRFLLGAAQTGGRYAVAETTVLPGGGPPPHVHHREDELFYVLDGDFAFTLGDRVILGSAGFCRNLPRGIPHTFKNVGSRPGRLLVVATPPGFEAFVRAGGTPVTDRREPVDSYNAPAPPSEEEVARMMAACAQYGIEMRFNHHAAGLSGWHNSDRLLSVMGERVRIKARAADTNGNFSVAEVTTRAGGRVPPHLHRREDEFFYVLEGDYLFQAAGRTITAPAGTFLHVPKGTPHGFHNPGPGPARLLDVHTPAGFERFCEDAAQGECRSVASPHLADPDALTALLARHGMELQPT